MNKVNADTLSNKGETTRPRSLTPAILGIPKSHGVKLSLMTSEGKKEFMEKLEEWRKERREKLAAKILAKQKVVENPKLQISSALTKKTKPPTAPCVGIPKFQGKESVFERLYKGNGRFKKSEVNNTSNKITEVRNIKKSVFVTSSKLLEVSEIDAKARACELVAEENLNGLTNLSNLSEVSSEDTNTKRITQNTSKATDLTFNGASQFLAHKSLEPKHVTSKSVEMKKLEINKSLRLTEAAFKNLPLKTGVKVPTDGSKIPLRRSISMLFRQKNKKDNIRRSLSEKNIHELQGVRASVDDTKLSLEKEAAAKSVSFVKPKSKRLFSSTHLRSGLEDWLILNGHSLEGYRHLRCFGIENNSTLLLPAPSTQLDNPFETSQFRPTSNSPSDESDKENMTPPTVISQVNIIQAENWLKELHRLISEVKYPSDRCEDWLAAIRKKYPKCSQLPIYWECMAALNESKGDVKSAIEDYEIAIIKGGQVDSVGESLALLFDKMVIEQKKPTKSKIDKGIDPKNIFKSTIIKFALQQKTLKKLGPQIAPSVREQLYIATPVRRSSRIQTPFKSEEVASLETLTPDVKKKLTFKPNESLMEAD